MAANMEAIIQSSLNEFNRGDLEGYLDLYTPDAALHYLPPGLPNGVAGARMFYSMFMSAFPDMCVEVEDSITEGDRIAVRICFTGTHQGELMGVPASGKTISVRGMTILRFEDDKCAERWSEIDMVGLMAQIGAIPA